MNPLVTWFGLFLVRKEIIKMDNEEMKRAIYDKLSPRRRKFIDKIGYDKWEPFQEPNHPIDIRKDLTKRTAAQLKAEFFQENEKDDLKTTSYGSGVHEMCMGIYSSDDKYKGMLDFCIWYYEKLKEQGIHPDQIWER